MDSRLDSMLMTQDVLAALVVEASDALLDRAPEDGWSARQVMAFLRDYEYLYMRPALTRALAEDRPEVEFAESTEWKAGRPEIESETRERLLADFALQRRVSLAILNVLQPDDWRREMHNSSFGTFTIDALVDRWLAHDVEQVSRIEALVGKSVAEVIGRNAQLPREKVWPLGRSEWVDPSHSAAG